MHFSCTNTLKTGNPCKAGLPFRAIKKAVLGTRYTVSLVFVGDARSRTLNRTYRGKNRPANILSFPLAADEGEIFINPRQAARDARNTGISARNYIGILFIHGLFHLKGYLHGSTMEHEEARVQKKFKLNT